MPLILPESCHRKLNCKPYSSIESDDWDEEKDMPFSFICVGLHDKTELKDDPNVQNDKFCVCWHNEYVDTRDFWNKNDLTDTVSVFAQALSADQYMGD